MSVASKIWSWPKSTTLWFCLGCAAVLDVIGALEGLGFAPSFQLEAQPLFFVGMVAAVFFTAAKVKIGPVLAGVIFWIPIIVLGGEVVVSRQLIPFGGDIVGICELVVAVVGVLAAHNVYHGYQRKKPS